MGGRLSVVFASYFFEQVVADLLVLVPGHVVVRRVVRGGDPLGGGDGEAAEAGGEAGGEEEEEADQEDGDSVSGGRHLLTPLGVVRLTG